jgi:pyridoxamine 5'-phosphate oxidase family protein
MARTTFTPSEIAYLNTQILGRIATVDAGGAPRVVPTGFRYNPETGTIDLGGIDLAATRRFQDVRGNPRVAIVIDDLASTNPWRARSVRVRGIAEVFEQGGEQIRRGLGSAWMRVTPTAISSSGLDESELLQPAGSSGAGSSSVHGSHAKRRR